MYGSRSVSWLNVRNVYCQLSHIASYHGSAMFAVTIRCQKSCYIEEWMVVVAEEDRVNHGGTISRNEQASHCRRCAVHCRRQKSMVCRLLEYHQRRLGVTVFICQLVSHPDL